MKTNSESTQWLLRALAMWSRVLTAEQVARWFGVAVPTAEAMLADMTRSRLVLRQRAQAQLLAVVDGPIYRHRPGDPLPAPGALSWRARKRFDDRPVQELFLYSAAPKTVAMFGLPDRERPKPAHATHDILCGEMWLYALRRWPRLTALCFEMEDVYVSERVKFEKVEDARLFRRGETLCVFESIGRYSPARVRDFLGDMNDRGLGFFAW